MWTQHTHLTVTNLQIGFHSMSIKPTQCFFNVFTFCNTFLYSLFRSERGSQPVPRWILIVSMRLHIWSGAWLIATATAAGADLTVCAPPRVHFCFTAVRRNHCTFRCSTLQHKAWFTCLSGPSPIGGWTHEHVLWCDKLNATVLK